MDQISVIIPTLNEEDWIEASLRSVDRQPGPKQIIVSDGGSSDQTRLLAERFATVIRAPRGRAAQMNSGARSARGNILLFLHADTLLPEGAFTLIRRKLNAPRFEAGIFRLSFDRTSPLLNFYSLCTRVPTPMICFGDRGLFVQREVFEEVGGYPEIPMFEDLELACQLHARGRFLFAEPAVITAARRFDRNGALHQQLQNIYLWLNYMLGGDPKQRADRYTYETD
jgi:rSAM/selenodomain-associated transferase 2